MNCKIRVELSELILKNIIEQNERLKVENEQLREALKKSAVRDYHCVFCNKETYERHTPDCEYIRLIGGHSQ